MLTVAVILAVLAAALHGYIFVLESLRWEAPRTRAVFATTPEQAAATRELAYNQGFYNLFLGVVTVVGAVLVGAERDAAVALLVAGPGSMLAASLVLLSAGRSRLRPALVQGTLPALSLLALLAWALV